MKLPLSQHDAQIFDANLEKLADLSGNPNRPASDEAKARADHIVKCVNEHSDLVAALEKFAPDYLTHYREREGCLANAREGRHPGRGFWLTQADLRRRSL